MAPFRLVNRHKMLAPRKCILCEHVPEYRVVDTGYKMDNVPAKNTLRGRKYVCEMCTEKLSRAMGFVTQERFETTLQQAIDAKNEVDRLSKLVESFNAFEQWLEVMARDATLAQPAVEDEDEAATGGD
jgi:hypothetical protein